ncbi:ABC-type nitrate/sulfonate/bicarbonate transport systems, periplasmic binding component [Desulfamplus magnetovallimortis]|uniref:ABC-type nitrate/sulfonate/bicarbonate transport systems, periplasmic binding component n=1 Tax=Desulfamplus magnetovallimortis TaxID=1246637 RepID=L0R744_9BACT|nr:ABC transporter substrate-binding protein [Desulfamplus magnetovallimortis]CCO06786.1 ABC-type nitrate/sulfonate/bicarbonate transport systems, periplasmic binding component [Desulfamplus magnetovallimortis BW-1]SLM32837.1 ABC-type nitrate/sulfonate/bicarbonate transport systems, periplasmic binding component [Desulfamplus magnetovallimortis]
MAEKPTLRIGHLSITDHLILGVTDLKLKKGAEKFEHCNLQTVLKNGWNEVADALTVKSLDGAFILAPTAMDLYKSGVGIKLLLLTHKNGSILVKNKRAHIEKIEDFAGKTVLIPYQLSIHNMLFHRLLSEKGLKPGRSVEPDVDVTLEVVAPFQMPEALQYDEEGEIGGFIVAEPFGSQVITSGLGEEFYLSKELWPKHPCCVFVVRDEIIEKHPEAIQEITTSLVKSGKAIDAQPDPASVIGANFLSQDVEVIKRVLTKPADRITTNELLPVIEDLDMIQQYMMDKMKIMTSLIDLEKFIDTSFAKEAGAQ